MIPAIHEFVVFGAGGQLGRSLGERLSKDGRVLGLTHQTADILDAEAVRRAVEQAKPQVVVNAAAWTHVDGCEADVTKAYEVNAIGAENVAAAAAGAGAKMVQISTDYVFDGFQKKPYTEQDDPNPLSIYGKSKLEGERLVLEACPDALLLRTSWLFGMGRANFVMRLFETVMQKTEVPVVTDRFGSPTFTEDLSDALCNLLQKGAKGIVHASNQGVCNWHDYAVEILRQLGITHCKILPAISGVEGRKAPRPEYSALDNTRYAQITGQAMRPWQEALGAFLSGLKREMTTQEVWQS